MQPDKLSYLIQNMISWAALSQFGNNKNSGDDDDEAQIGEKKQMEGDLQTGETVERKEGEQKRSGRGQGI